MILLDTNVLSELMKKTPEKKVLEWLDSSSVSTYYINAITKAEIKLGIALLPDGQRKAALQTAAGLTFGEFFERCLAFDTAAASDYAMIVAHRSSIGRPVSVEEAQIAAIALSNRMSLATRNVKDFDHIYGLSVINPWLE